jgi:tetratricopeptide (TPR) repeat protein
MSQQFQAEAVRSRMRQWMAGGHWTSAEQLASTWLATGGSDWQIRLNLAVCRARLHLGTEQSRLALAEAAFEQSQAHPAAGLALAELSIDAGLWEQGTSLLEEMKPASLSPQQRGSWAVLLARALARLGQNQEARQVLETIPAGERSWPWSLALADAWIQDCCWQEAEVLLRQVLQGEPNLVAAHQNLALLLLIQRRCNEAWPHYEWRRSNPRLNRQGQPVPIPVLADLKDRTLLVLGEQGIGDQIMYSRYLIPLAAAAKQVFVQPDARLVPLLRRQLPPSIQVIEDDSARQQNFPVEPSPSFEVLGMATLPMLFWSTLGFQTSQAGGYFQADDAKRAIWRDKLSRLGPGRCIGLGWLGGTNGSDTRERSLKAADQQRLLQIPGVNWIDLQFLGSNLDPLRWQSQNKHFHRFGDVGHDIEDNLALIACLDAVVTTRQTAAHLSGCIGKTGYVLVPNRPEWRYCGEDGNWDWYPSMQLMQQQKRGCWDFELQKIEYSLQTTCD